jgi:WD40 repeat protein
MSQDGRFVAGAVERAADGAVDCRVCVWDAVTGRRLLDLVGPVWRGDRVKRTAHVAFRSDGKDIVGHWSHGDDWSGPVEQAVKMWDVATGMAVDVPTLQGVPADLNEARLSPDGTLLAAKFGRINSRVEIKVWDLTTGREQCTLLGDVPSVRTLGFSADSRRVVTWPVGNHGFLTLWDVTTGQELLHLDSTSVRRSGLPDSTDILALSPDGKALVGESGARLHLWSIGEPAKK